MWGRHRSETARERQATESGGLQPLGAIDDLRRRAAWERLSEAERGALRGEFAGYVAPPDADQTGQTDDALRQWVAALVTPTFQTAAAQVIGAWLSDAAPGAHLYVGGDAGQGRRSLTASLARQAMARQPSPPDYCYVPQPAAMEQAVLLAVPGGTGGAFTKAIDRALRRLTAGWSGESADGDDHASGSAQSAAEPSTAARGQLIAQAFAPLQAPELAPTRAYVERLRAAFEALAASESDLPVSYDDMPTWLVSASAGTPASASASDAGDSTHYAPVVVGTLVRDKLDDLLIRANGGVLILPASDVLGVDGAWPALSVALARRNLQVKPSWPPLPLTTRVALIGDGAAYNALAGVAGDFAQLFRYETWLRPGASWTPRSEAAYATLADGAARIYGLPACDSSAVARLIEEGARRGDGLNRSYLITDLLLLRDLTVEAGRLASARGATTTSGTDVAAALARRRAQQSGSAQRVREAILSGQANTPTAGSAIGQINGLGIYEFHPSEGDFAVPTRISATVSPGRDARLLDIEREAEQADADHVRGEMTIEGYLAYRYGQERPIRLMARVRFEQEHGTTGGDSASAALLFTILSSLAQVPLRFSHAVTGAVGQHGELQPIGGVNTKIEGFWELCRLRRAQGEQAEGGYGALIPAVNARDLMLRDEVAESIASEGWFRVWPVTTVDEALTILTGLPATEVHARVEKRLQQFREAAVETPNRR